MEARIDTRNPGEVLACAGIACIASRADPLAETGFDIRDGETIFHFPGDVIAKLDLGAFSIHSATSAPRINTVTLDWWEKWGLNPGMKLWAGQQSADSVWDNLVAAAKAGSATDWLTFATTTTGRLGVDCMGTWNALRMGWSLNQHTKDYQMLCRPFVESLAFVGLQGFPLRGDRREGFEYHPWRRAPYPIARLAFAGASHHALAHHRAGTTKAGSNTILLAATVTRETS